MQAFKIVSLNVNGIGSPVKRRAVFTALRKLKADFILLQETHSIQSLERIWLSEWGAEGYFSHGSSNSCGVATLFGRGLSPTVLHTYGDKDGRLLVLQLKVNDEVLTITNIYAPTQNFVHQQIELVSHLQDQLGKLEIRTLLLGGDFNVKLDDQQTSRTQTSNPLTPTRDSYYNLIQSLLEEYNLVDTWKKLHPSSTRGTLHRKNYSARLDYLFIPEHLFPSVVHMDIIPETLSDHSILSLQISISAQKRGPGFWRFDNNLLANENFILELKEHLMDIWEEEMSDPNKYWEWIKYNIRTFTISFSIRKAREENRLFNSLQTRFKTLSEQYDTSPTTTVYDVLQSVKRELGEIEMHKANRTIFRTKARWAQLGEKPTAYFLGLEKRRSKGNTITSIKDDSGNILTSNSDILEQERHYFSQIYEEDSSVLLPIDTLPLSAKDVPQVTKVHKDIYNLPFTKRELHSALKELNKNKTPGSD